MQNWYYEDLSKISEPPPKKRSHNWIFLLWQHTTTSYKTRKTHSDFYLNFCAGKAQQGCDKSKMNKNEAEAIMNYLQKKVIFT